MVRDNGAMRLDMNTSRSWLDITRFGGIEEPEEEVLVDLIVLKTVFQSAVFTRQS